MANRQGDVDLREPQFTLWLGPVVHPTYTASEDGTDGVFWNVAHDIPKPGNHPEESIQHSDHANDKILKSRLTFVTDLQFCPYNCVLGDPTHYVQVNCILSSNGQYTAQPTNLFQHCHTHIISNVFGAPCTKQQHVICVCGRDSHASVLNSPH
jgi:hypothetical protein